MHERPDLAAALAARMLAAAPLIFAGVLLALDPAKCMLELHRVICEFAGGVVEPQSRPIAARVRVAVRSIGLALALWGACYLAGVTG